MNAKSTVQDLHSAESINKWSRCGSGSGIRDFGRRTMLLHLSGLPCRYQRRVVGTKSTTSKPLLSYS